MLLRKAFDRVQRVGAEHAAAKFAVVHVLAMWDTDPVLNLAARRARVSDGELTRAAQTLGVTFALRMFSEYEAILRDYWAKGLRRTTQPEMRRLMDSVARRRKINPSDLQAAHVVRDYRNAITHVGPPATVIQLADCQRGLGRYLRWLPQQW